MLSSETKRESGSSDTETANLVAGPVSADRWTVSALFKRLEELERIEKASSSSSSTLAPS